VLSPTLFNLYINDLHITGSRNFVYADDICLTKQAQTYAELECCLSSDMERMAAYCRLWRLKPSTTKTVSSIFHLQNTSAARELRVHIRALHGPGGPAARPDRTGPGCKISDKHRAGPSCYRAGPGRAGWVRPGGRESFITRSRCDH